MNRGRCCGETLQGMPLLTARSRCSHTHPHAPGQILRRTLGGVISRYEGGVLSRCDREGKLLCREVIESQTASNGKLVPTLGLMADLVDICETQSNILRKAKECGL